MPFPFALSTTSHLTFQNSFTSSTHPSLPSAATSQRNIVRAVLKSHKRLSAQHQGSNLGNVLSCVNEYLKYLLSIDAALSGKPVADEDIELALAKEVEVEWRPTLALSTVPGRDRERVKGRGLDYEICFIYQTLCVVQNLLARQSLLGLYAPTNPTPEQRVSLIQSALKFLASAYAIHRHIDQRAHSGDGQLSIPPRAVDIANSTQTALRRLTHAEIDLLCVLKDDPYPAVLSQARNENDKEWMIKAPDIPKTRAQVLTRLCIGASEHAAAASATLKAEGKAISKELIEYAEDVRATARARACRFQALDHDSAGQTSVALAWLYAGLSELGIEVSKDSGKTSSLSRLKTSWQERREDKKIGKGSAKWGSDGGKIEEHRILEYLERKFAKQNNTINIQPVPEWRPLVASLPSGMNMPVDEALVTALLTEHELTPMRAPPEEDVYVGDSSGEDDDDVGLAPTGAFPGTGHDYSRAASTYY